MRRSVVLLWLVRHPSVVAWAILLPVLFGGYRLVVGVGSHFLAPAVQRAGYAPLSTDYVPDEVLVRFRSGGAGAVNAAVGRAGALAAEPVRGTGFHRLRLPAGRAVTAALDALAPLGDVEWAEPNYRVRTCRRPSGPRFDELWGMRNIGRHFTSRSCGEVDGTPGSDIGAERAWDTNRGSHTVIVGVIDTGIDAGHPNLKENLWTNPGEIPDNNVDDDRNGYVDDVHGYDFVNRKGDPKDEHGHGTHVSGTIGAAGRDATGVVGVNWETRLMALKFLDKYGFGDVAHAAEALAYARSFDVKVTNNSWGGGGFSKALYEEIRKTPALFVAAAGNNAFDTDTMPSYPACYDLPNVIAVAASDPRDNLGCFSNFGQTSIDVAAPGVAVLSTLPTYPCTLTEAGLSQGYDYLDGTSMANPHGTGAVALLQARWPSESEPQRRHRLIATTRACEALRGRCVGNGRIDLNEGVGRRLVPPIAEAGNDTAIPPDYPLALDGSASVPYPGRRAASYVWSERGKVLSRSRRPAFTYRTSERGAHLVHLQVVDNESQSGTDDIAIEVADKVMTGTEITFERADRQTLRITATVQDMATQKPVAGAEVVLFLETPTAYFRAIGRTGEDGKCVTEWKPPYRLRRGAYMARLMSLTHRDYAWDRKRTTATWEL